MPLDPLKCTESHFRKPLAGSSNLPVGFSVSDEDAPMTFKASVLVIHTVRSSSVSAS